MSKLKDVVYGSSEQLENLFNGQTISGHTYNENDLYVEELGDDIELGASGSGTQINSSNQLVVVGKQDTIDSTHKLSADLVDDTSTTNKFVTASEKSSIGTAMQPGDNVGDLTNNVGYLTASSISGKEDTSNKVTTISSSSTDTQYPSAAAVYNYHDATKSSVSVNVSGTATDSVKYITIDGTEKKIADTYQIAYILEGSD